ncbi:MAG TPA: putative toxin-antitoxin system toxin component, PIN family [Gammaproteobacteria bacterium]|nr:putative toxin-antitoxin system toxin component, PIN family [Gammaproteobacteria bacterium]
MGIRDSGGRKYKVVLDTNLYVSAFLCPDGVVARIAEQARRAIFLPVISPFIMNELGHILRTKTEANDAAIIAYLKQIAQSAIIVQPETVERVVPNDPDDDHIVACAIAGNADLIVSGDKHLRNLGSSGSIPIVHPTDFARMLGGM